VVGSSRDETVLAREREELVKEWLEGDWRSRADTSVEAEEEEEEKGGSGWDDERMSGSSAMDLAELGGGKPEATGTDEELVARSREASPLCVGGMEAWEVGEGVGLSGGVV